MKAFKNDSGHVYLVAYDHLLNEYRSIFVCENGDLSITMETHNTLEEVYKDYQEVEVKIVLTSGAIRIR